MQSYLWWGEMYDPQVLTGIILVARFCELTSTNPQNKGLTIISADSPYLAALQFPVSDDGEGTSFFGGATYPSDHFKVFHIDQASHKQDNNRIFRLILAGNAL